MQIRYDVDGNRYNFYNGIYTLILDDGSLSETVKYGELGCFMTFEEYQAYKVSPQYGRHRR